MFSGHISTFAVDQSKYPFESGWQELFVLKGKKECHFDESRYHRNRTMMLPILFMYM